MQRGAALMSGHKGASETTKGEIDKNRSHASARLHQSMAGSFVPSVYKRMLEDVNTYKRVTACFPTITKHQSCTADV